MKWQACSDKPTPLCIASLAVDGASKNSDQMFLIHLVQSGYIKREESRYFPVQAFVPEILSMLEDARKTNLPHIDVRRRLEAIEKSYLENNRKTSNFREIITLYKATAAQILKGVPSLVAARESIGIGGIGTAVVRSRLGDRYGAALDIFLQRWKELAAIDGTLTSFGETMLQLGRTEDARWAAGTAGKAFHGKSCRGADLWLKLGEPSKAETATIATRCYRQRAETAQQYAQMGQVDMARRVANELLKELPQYIAELEHTIDGDNLMETVRPLVRSLWLIGERDRAIQQIRQLEHRFEVRTSVSFGGRSFGLPDVAALLYDIGAEDEADRVVERIIETANSMESQDFHRLILKCRLGKTDCIDDLMRFRGEKLDYESAIALYTLAIYSNRIDINPSQFEFNFNFDDAFRLQYFDLQRELQRGNEAAALQHIQGILDNESKHVDAPQILRLVFLLRVAVAMENKPISIRISKLILDRAATTDSDVDSGGEGEKALQRAKYLAETAAVLAQL